jgi:hypothetical protein
MKAIRASETIHDVDNKKEKYRHHPSIDGRHERSLKDRKKAWIGGILGRLRAGTRDTISI